MEPTGLRMNLLILTTIVLWTESWFWFTSVSCSYTGAALQSFKLDTFGCVIFIMTYFQFYISLVWWQTDKHHMCDSWHSSNSITYFSSPLTTVQFIFSETRSHEVEQRGHDFSSLFHNFPSLLLFLFQQIFTNYNDADEVKTLNRLLNVCSKGSVRYHSPLLFIFYRHPDIFGIRAVDTSHGQN